MAACRACGKRNAVPGAGKPALLLPLRLVGAKEDGDGWCQACAMAHNAVGIVVWAIFALLAYRVLAWLL